jgi:hypothetical protein
MEHYDISNNQENLFNVINRSYMLDGIEGLPVQKGIRIDNFRDLIDDRNEAKYPYERYGQLDGLTHIGTFGKENSQPSRLLEPTINCTPRVNIPASRFNYAYDKQIDNRLIDVSGVEIPNKFLRVIPNRGIQTTGYQKQYIPTNKQIEKLANDITNISYEPADTNAKLKFKASRERLTRAELLGVNEIKPIAPQPVFVLRAPPTGGIGKPPPSGLGIP